MFHVKGRSADGTVWYGRGFWSTDRAEAQPLSRPAAEQVIADRVRRNRESDADSVIGRLEVLPIGDGS